jgi:hypothetical protein
VISPPGMTDAGAGPPRSNATAVTDPATTTRPASVISQRLRLRAAARWARPPGAPGP